MILKLICRIRGHRWGRWHMMRVDAWERFWWRECMRCGKYQEV